MGSFMKQVGLVVLLVLVKACNGHQEWNHRREQQEGDSASVTFADDWIPKLEYSALYRLFGAFNMSSLSSIDWFRLGLLNPLSDDYCNFTGVSCDEDGHVIGLDLRSKRLSGTLPADLTSFLHLAQLRLEHNFINGGLLAHHFPSSMTQLGLTGNYLRGTIPESICNLTNLQFLGLSINTKMWGTLPDCLADLTGLVKLRITGIGLTGTIPQGLCSSNREMNGLSPNKFGCDAIGCGAGYFQRAGGRQRNEETACKLCQVPSNVIASTRCLWVNRDGQLDSQGSGVPVGEPTLAPSFAPSPKPSPSPSLRPTVKPSARSQSPSLKPTDKPTSSPTDKSTSSPTDKPTSSRTVVPSTGGPTTYQELPRRPVSQAPVRTNAVTLNPSATPSLAPQSGLMSRIVEDPTPGSSSLQTRIIAISVTGAVALVCVWAAFFIWRRPGRNGAEIHGDGLCQDSKDSSTSDGAPLPPPPNSPPHLPVHSSSHGPIDSTSAQSAAEDLTPSITRPTPLLRSQENPLSLPETLKRVRFELPNPISWSSADSGDETFQSTGNTDKERTKALGPDNLASCITSPLFAGVCTPTNLPREDDECTFVEPPHLPSDSTSRQPASPFLSESSLHCCLATASRQERQGSLNLRPPAVLGIKGIQLLDDDRAAREDLAANRQLVQSLEKWDYFHLPQPPSAADEYGEGLNTGISDDGQAEI